MRTILKYALILAVGIVVAFGGWKWIFRERSVEYLSLVQFAGGTLDIRLIRSSRYYFGSGHWGYGGGDDRAALEFEYGSQMIRWRGEENHEPRVLQIYRNQPYLVVQENHWQMSTRDNLGFFRFEGDAWKKISSSEFPPEIALCNVNPFGPRWKEGEIEHPDGPIRVLNGEERYVQELLDQRFGKGGN